jgi:uncharacterized protein (DUF697 family)
MILKKYISLFNIKDQIIKSIETFNADPQTLVTNEDKKNAALSLIESVSKLNGTIALQPVPFADIFLLTPIQVSMVIKIAKIYGKDTDNKVIQEVVATLIKGIFARTFARSIIKLIPVLGIPVCYFTSYIMTEAIGITAIKIFEDKNEFNLAVAQEKFEKEYQKMDPVNVVISTAAVSVGQSRQPTEPLSHKIAAKKDLKTIESETRNTIIYLPAEN